MSNFIDDDEFDIGKDDDEDGNDDDDDEGDVIVWLVARIDVNFMNFSIIDLDSSMLLKSHDKTSEKLSLQNVGWQSYIEIDVFRSPAKMTRFPKALCLFIAHLRASWNFNLKSNRE